MQAATIFLVAVLVTSHSVAAANADAETPWQALQAGGHVALMRHATAPGTGDPPGFRIDDCTTQRTLSAEGRLEAKRIGAAFRARAVPVEGVWSSQWCRCLETAELLDLGTPIPLPALNSFFEDRGEEADRTAAVRAFLAALPLAGTAVLVTHQVNITALTGIVPRPGETVVAKPLAGGGLKVVGRIPPP